MNNEYTLIEETNNTINEKSIFLELKTPSPRNKIDLCDVWSPDIELTPPPPRNKISKPRPVNNILGENEIMGFKEKDTIPRTSNLVSSSSPTINTSSLSRKKSSTQRKLTIQLPSPNQDSPRKNKLKIPLTPLPRYKLSESLSPGSLSFGSLSPRLLNSPDNSPDNPPEKSPDNSPEKSPINSPDNSHECDSFIKRILKTCFDNSNSHHYYDQAMYYN